VQFTINAYPKGLEHSVVHWERSVDAAEGCIRVLGQGSVVWRYDPVILSQETPLEHHLESFERIAKRLQGVTDEVVISFVQLYRKTINNLNRISSKNPWEDPSAETKIKIAEALFEIALRHDMTLKICSQPEFTTTEPPAKCIDAERLSRIANKPILSKTLGNRLGCECAESKDIGAYDTCPHGCVYCYAVRSPELAISQHKNHDPSLEFLTRSANEDLKPIKSRPKQRRLDV
jgi:hypothetical protein